MANIIKDILDVLKLKDDDEYYENEYDEEEEKPLKKDKNFVKETSMNEEENDIQNIDDIKKNRQEKAGKVVRNERTSSDKVIPIKKTNKGLEVCIMRPTSFSDAQDVCDMLRNGIATVVNLEGFNSEEAQRTMDFISGCVYAIDGKLHTISEYIFIFSPKTIDISGDTLELVSENDGIQSPTIPKEF